MNRRTFGFGLIMIMIMMSILFGCADKQVETQGEEPAGIDAGSIPLEQEDDVEAQKTEPYDTATPKDSFIPEDIEEDDDFVDDRVPLDVFDQAKKLGRGVNLGNALEAKFEGEWGLRLQESYFPLIKEGGFDTIRVPIKWSAHAANMVPYTIDETFFERIDWVIDNALANDLNVVINVHHYDELFKDPEGHTERFLAIWRQITKRYRERPSTVYFELLNEPHEKLTILKWNELLEKTLKQVRKVDTYHTVIIGGGNWNGIDDLRKLKLPEDDRNIIGTFHFYDPFLFTHQGAEWSGPEIGTVGVIWPGPPETPIEPIEASLKVGWVRDWFENYNTLPSERNPSGPLPMVRQLDKASKWSEDNNRPLWLGEFGAYGKADMASRARWTAFVREEAEKRGFSWAYWEFGAGFGVYDRVQSRWNEDLHRALIPK